LNPDRLLDVVMADKTTRSAPVNEALRTSAGEPITRTSEVAAQQEGGSGWGSWLIRPISVDWEPHPFGARYAWIALASAVLLGVLYGAEAWRLDRHAQAFVPLTIVHAVAALVITPLVVGVHLWLPDLTGRLLWRLQDNKVIPSTAWGKVKDRTARAFHLVGHNPTVGLVAAGAASYFAYLVLSEVRGGHSRMTSVSSTALLVVTLAAQAVLFYVGVTVVVHLMVVARAIGGLLHERSAEVHVQPLHPDHCGGLWVVGHMFGLLLYVAAVLGAAGLCIGLLWHQAGVPFNRRPEPYLLAAFYLMLLPSAFIYLLWRPHRLLERHRFDTLKPVAEAFHGAMAAASPLETDVAMQLKEKTDRLAEISRQFRVLEEGCPTWPLRTRGLRSVLITAILPVVIPVLVAVINKLVAP
jgi:hypothetical protein